MEQWQRIAINAVVGFLLTTVLYLLFGEPWQIAVGFGFFAGIGFGIAVWVLDRMHEWREARR